MKTVVVLEKFSAKRKSWSFGLGQQIKYGKTNNQARACQLERPDQFADSSPVFHLVLASVPRFVLVFFLSVLFTVMVLFIFLR